MPSDRVLGMLSFGVATTVATWGGALADAGSPEADRESAVVAGPMAEEMPPPDGSTTTTTGTASIMDGASTTTTAPPETTTTTSAIGSGTTTTTRKKATTSTSGSSTTTTSGRHSSASDEADQAAARRILVGPGDLPPGFSPVGQPPAEGSGADGAFERCLGSDAPRLTAAVRAKSRAGEFAKRGTGSVSSSSAVFEASEPATRVLEVLTTAEARQCFEALINERLARNPNLPPDAKGKLSPLDPGPLGEQSTGFRFEVLLPAEDVDDNAQGGQIPYIADFFFVRRGRSIALLEFGNLRKPFPAGDARSIASSVIARA